MTFILLWNGKRWIHPYVLLRERPFISPMLHSLYRCVHRYYPKDVKVEKLVIFSSQGHTSVQRQFNDVS